MPTRAKMRDRRQIAGTIPLVYPNGAAQNLGDGIALRPAVAGGVNLNAVPGLRTGGAGVALAHPVLNANAPFHPLQTSALGLAPGGIVGGVPLTGVSRAVIPGKNYLKWT